MLSVFSYTILFLLIITISTFFIYGFFYYEINTLRKIKENNNKDYYYFLYLIIFQYKKYKEFCDILKTGQTYNNAINQIKTKK